MNPSRFDDLTKALATATSRRQALGRIGGTLAGSLLAAWPFTQALAAGGGNSACAHFCAEVFGADTPAARQCTSDAAHGKGLCSTCGSNADPSSICCTRNSRGFCSNYSPTLPCSCGTNQTCCNGTCSDCPCGQVMFHGACATPCSSDADCPCGSCGFAYPSGGKYCVGNVTGGNCETTSECPSGYICIIDGVMCVELC